MKHQSKNQEVLIQSSQGRWSFQSIGAESFYWKESTQIDGSYDSNWMTGDSWLFAIIEPQAGKFSFYWDDKLVRSESHRFGVFLTKWAMVRLNRSDVKYTAEGVWSREEPDIDFPQTSILFDLDVNLSVSASASAGAGTTLSEVKSVLQNATQIQSIDVGLQPSVIAKKAKRAIDLSFRTPGISMNEIALKCQTSSVLLSRYFKKAYRIGPSEYKNVLRVTEARFLIAQKLPLVEVAKAVGFGSLSRLDKAMKKVSLVLPSQMQGKRSKLPSSGN